MPDLIVLLSSLSPVAADSRACQAFAAAPGMKLAATAACCILNRNSEGEQRPSHSMCETLIAHTSSFTFAEIAVDPAVVQMLHLCSRTVGSN